MDTYSANAAQLVPKLLDITLDSALLPAGPGDARRTGTTSRPPTRPAAAYFNVVWRNLLKLTFDDELPKGQGPEGGERWFNVVGTILDKPDSHWWDDVTTIGRREIARRHPRRGDARWRATS